MSIRWKAEALPICGEPVELRSVPDLGTKLDWCFSGWRPSTLRILKETDEILLAEQQRDVNHLPILIEKRERGNPAPYLDVFHGIHRRRAGRK
jgi:hypothetical protein